MTDEEAKKEKPEEPKKKKKAPAKKKKAAPKKKAKKKAKKNKKPTGKHLVIVESPAKAKTINKILGRKFVVKASMGHVRDLPKRKFGIEVENDFEPTYRPIRSKSKVIKELKADAKKAPTVFLAPDPDREGEAIAWHLVEALKIPEEKIRRVTFNEITKRGVEEAFKEPGQIIMHRVHAQQARRILDRIVGYKLSPLLWEKIGKGLSAGRVQSVAVRLIVERENEIRAFKADEYWTVTAHFKGEHPFTAVLTAIEGQDDSVTVPDNFEREEETKDAKKDRRSKVKFILRTKEATDALLKEIEGGEFRIFKIEKKERQEKSPPPFITSLLQQRASTVLRYSAKRTMAIAQQLYEGVDLGGDRGSVGLITYMRTDSFRVSQDALTEVRNHIETSYGKPYLPEKPIFRAARKGAQEAHEAIRPTHVEYQPSEIKSFLSDEQFKMYRMIWERFVASQMNPAVYLLTDAKIKVGRATFSAKGRETKFDGYTKILGHKTRKDDQILPTLEEDQVLDLDHIDPKQHFTEPPARYSEASLVRALEKHGIGRPSTYAPTISTVQDRGYVRQEERRLIPTELGELVNGKLLAHFANIVNTGFTAGMEKNLDGIEEGESNWITVLKDFYDPFIKDIEKATVDMESVKDKVAEGEECAECKKPMLIRWNRDGKFLGCSGFPDCRYTKSLQSPEAAGEDCDECGSPMTVKRGRFGKFLACMKYPECKNTRSISRGRKRVSTPKDWKEECEKCNKPMKVRYGRRGPFIACTGFPDCKNTKPIPKEWYKKPDEEPAKDESESDDNKDSD